MNRLFALALLAAVSCVGCSLPDPPEVTATESEQADAVSRLEGTWRGNGDDGHVAVDVAIDFDGGDVVVEGERAGFTVVSADEDTVDIRVHHDYGDRDARIVFDGPDTFRISWIEQVSFTRED